MSIYAPEITGTQMFKPFNRTYFTQNNLIEQSPQSKGWITEGLLFDAALLTFHLYTLASYQLHEFYYSPIVPLNYMASLLQP